MVSSKIVEDQLKKIGFNYRGWNRPECDELAKILLPDEEIFECVNGWYEGGYSLIVATNIRVLLIDKKPFKYLNVEDVRFDTINQIDYSHRMFNASISIAAGMKNLVFRSYNQERLRKLIGHVQHRMAELKHHEQAERAKNLGNLEEMDQQLRAYYQSRQQDENLKNDQPQQAVQPVNRQATEEDGIPAASFAQPAPVSATPDHSADATGASTSQLYEDGIKEIFGRYQLPNETEPQVQYQTAVPQLGAVDYNGTHVNPLKIAYSKLPLILSIKKRNTVPAI